MFTAHIPGNWGNAEMGGRPRTLNIAHAPMLKKIIRMLDAENRRLGLSWPVSLEADHHGPTCDVPIIFVEIGNGEGEWKDEKAAEVVAEAVASAVAPAVFPETENQAYEVVFGVGGGHYSRGFTRLMLETGLAVGHIAPKYALDGLDGEMFRQAVERNVGKVTKVAILKDETNAAQKEKIRMLAERFGLEVEMF
jgi:D-aminoacyl-tRNA deacylase